jgi:hypothetical protein
VGVCCISYFAGLTRTLSKGLVKLVLSGMVGHWRYLTPTLTVLSIVLRYIPSLSVLSPFFLLTASASFTSTEIESEVLLHFAFPPLIQDTESLFGSVEWWVCLTLVLISPARCIRSNLTKFLALCPTKVLPLIFSGRFNIGIGSRFLLHFAFSCCIRLRILTPW